MKKYAIIGVLVVLISTAIVLRAPTGARVADMRGLDARVVLTDNGFDPQQIRINRGQSVTFTTTRKNQFWPASNPHPVHSIYGEFDPKVPIEPGASWSFTFNKSGQWHYHDHIRSYFTGVIYVD